MEDTQFNVIADEFVLADIARWIAENERACGREATMAVIATGITGLSENQLKLLNRYLTQLGIGILPWEVGTRTYVRTKEFQHSVDKHAPNSPTSRAYERYEPWMFFLRPAAREEFFREWLDERDFHRKKGRPEIFIYGTLIVQLTLMFLGAIKNAVLGVILKWGVGRSSN